MSAGPIIVTGASGYLGQRICREWGAETIGVSRSRPSGVDNWHVLDLLDGAATNRLLDTIKPRAIVHCAAAQAGSTADDLAGVNADASERLAQWAADAGARFVFMSSDMVHRGDQGPYGDDAEPTPRGPYGESKADGERRVLATNPAAAVVRTSLIYGLDEIDRGTRSLADRLVAGEPLTLWQDVLRQPMEIAALANVLAELVRRPDIAGVLNVAGDDAVSRADFALALLAYWNIVVDASTVSLVSLGVQDAVPIDLRLDCWRARSLGLATPGVWSIINR